MYEVLNNEAVNEQLGLVWLGTYLGLVYLHMDQFWAISKIS